MTVEDKIAELGRRLGPDKTVTIEDITDIKKMPRHVATSAELAEAARKIRKSVIRFSRELEM